MLSEIQRIVVANLSWFVIGLVIGAAMTKWEMEHASARRSPAFFTAAAAVLIAVIALITKWSAFDLGYEFPLYQIGMTPTLLVGIAYAADAFALGIFVGSIFVAHDVFRYRS
jgi:hypothetical protein